MSTYIPIVLTIPAALKDTANRLAAIFDFDIGGSDTFDSCALSLTGTAPATHYMASTAIKPHYVAILTDETLALSALEMLSEQYGRERPSVEDISLFCSSVVLGEVEGLVRIEPETTV